MQTKPNQTKLITLRLCNQPASPLPFPGLGQPGASSERTCLQQGWGEGEAEDPRATGYHLPSLMAAAHPPATERTLAYLAADRRLVSLNHDLQFLAKERGGIIHFQMNSEGRKNKKLGVAVVVE